MGLTISKRVFIAGVILALLVGSASTYMYMSTLSPPVKLRKITVGFPSVLDLGHVGNFVAFEALRDKGIVVEHINLPSTKNAVECVITRECDVVEININSVLPAIQQGAALRTFMGALKWNAEYTFVVPNQISTLKDLEGKRVAHHGAGSFTEFLTHYFLEQAGIDKSKVQILLIPGSENRAAAILADKIEGSLFEVPETIQLLETGKYHVIGKRFPELFPGVIAGSLWWARADYLENNRDLVQTFCNEVQKAAAMMQKDPDVYIKIAKRLIPGRSESVYKGTYEQYKALGFFNPAIRPIVNKENIEKTLQFFKDHPQPFLGKWEGTFTFSQVAVADFEAQAAQVARAV